MNSANVRFSDGHVYCFAHNELNIHLYLTSQPGFSYEKETSFDSENPAASKEEFCFSVADRTFRCKRTDKVSKVAFADTICFVSFSF